MNSKGMLDASHKLFARLVRLYPRGFWQAYGAQVAQVFRDSSRDALAMTGASGLARLWLATVPDLLKTAAQEHLKEMNMSNFFSNPKAKALVAAILCLPLVIGQLLGLVGVDQNVLPAVANSAGFGFVLLGMMLVGLWLFGASPGLSILIGLLSALPFAIMELVNRRAYGEPFPFPLFIGLGLMGTIFAATLIPMIKEVRDRKATKPNWGTLLLRAAILLSVAIGWVALVADQMLCFLGVRYCD